MMRDPPISVTVARDGESAQRRAYNTQVRAPRLRAAYSISHADRAGPARGGGTIVERSRSADRAPGQPSLSQHASLTLSAALALV